MPDDYFNSHPKYAAGSDMDSIRTGRPIKLKPKRPAWGLIAIVITIFALAVLPKLIVQTKQQTETPHTTNSTAIASTDNKPEMKIKDLFLSADGKKVTVQISITNNMSKSIIKTEITYIIKDANDNNLTTTNKTITDNIQPKGKYEDTEIIVLESSQKSGIKASVEAVYQYWN